MPEKESHPSRAGADDARWQHACDRVLEARLSAWFRTRLYWAHPSDGTMPATPTLIAMRSQIARFMPEAQRLVESGPLRAHLYCKCCPAEEMLITLVAQDYARMGGECLWRTTIQWIEEFRAYRTGLS